MSKLIGAIVVLVVAALAVGVTMAVPSKDADAAAAKKPWFQESTAVGNIDPTGASPPVDARLLAHGQWVYRGLCIGCHGAKGDGNGGVWTLGDKFAKAHKLPRQPRDFTAAVFKVRSTPSGSLPTDADLFKAISRGLVADQDMPAFKFLPERDRWAVIAYIKTLSKRWQEEKDFQEPSVEVGAPPLPDAAALAAGKEVYAKMQCAKCHGPLGKGDGPSADELTDDSGLPIKPRDFSDASMFVAASDPRGVYQTFTTGLDGTPMPSFADFLKEDERWQLVWYVMSLRHDWTLDGARADVQRTRAVAAAASAASR
ncbi:MAG TPA: c-type cytochrome [Burkholderiaceae bacterium]